VVGGGEDSDKVCHNSSFGPDLRTRQVSGELG